MAFRPSWRIEEIGHTYSPKYFGMHEFVNS